jgi:hypothetical protein
METSNRLLVALTLLSILTFLVTFYYVSNYCTLEETIECEPLQLDVSQVYIINPEDFK